MSTKAIYGDWSTVRAEANNEDRELQELWMRLAAINDENPNFGLTQRKPEIMELWQLYRKQKPRIVLEIGVSQGGSFASWCQLGRRDAVIIGIDRCVDDCRPHPGCPRLHQSMFNGNIEPTSRGGGMYSLGRKEQKIVAINGWSYEPHVIQKLTETLGGQKVDFCFHDGSHSAEMFAKDFEIYWPFIAEDGIMAIQDICPSAHPDCNKSVTWDQIKRTVDYSALFEYNSGGPKADSMGIGVLIK